MSLETTSREKPVESFLSSLIEAHPDASMRDIAVLFTDLVGSTKYFKKYGDIKGRAMLRKHHAIATSVVHEYGGSLVKEVGDSVMVYFPDCLNALKAAIKMQHRFQTYNKEANVHHEIHVRIGIHFGKVIFEEKDIYGDVVNVAAKLTNLANGDQLFVSQEVYNLAKNLPSVHFELINFWNLKPVPTGLTIYKVIWETAPVLEPEKIAILYLCPVKSDISGNEIWKRFQEAKKGLFGGKPESIRDLPDGSMAVTYKDSSPALATAQGILSWFSERVEKAGPDAKYPLHIILDRNIHPREMKGRPDRPIQTEGTKPGFVYMTKPFYENIKLRRLVTVTPSPDKQPEAQFYQLVNNPASQEAQQKQTTVASGKEGLLSPCFYCGSKLHHPMDCPSKILTENTRKLAEFGRLSTNRIKILNATHPGYCNGSQTGNIHVPTLDNGEQDLVESAFYELTCVYQLRLFRAIWGSRSEEWDKAKHYRSESEGGFVWLAFDSLRVSNHERAEEYLKTAGEKDKKDFRLYCINGFINIEQEQLYTALDCFEKAYTLAKTKPQKIYILFQQYRLYSLMRKMEKMQETMAKILALDGSCTEAQYQDIVLKFKEKKDALGLQKLLRLIHEDRAYYTIALIDPDLEHYRESIDKGLEKLFEETKASSLRSNEEATTNIEAMSGTLRKKDLEEIGVLKARVADLMSLDSYFGYLDIIDINDNILNICSNALRYQKRDLSERTERIIMRIDKDLEFVRSYKYKQFSDGILKELKSLKSRATGLERVNDLFSSLQFDDSHGQCDYITDRLNTIEQKLKSLDFMQQMVGMVLGFLKTSSIMFSIVFFTGIFVFPFFADSISTFLSKFDVTSSSNVWSMQKMFLIFGGITSLVISFLLTIRSVAKDGPTFSK